MTSKTQAGDGERHKGGRPPKYDPTFPGLAFNYCLLGATDAELAGFFDVDERTINRWKDDHPEFCQSLTDGKASADGQVAEKLFRRALGYSHQAVKIAVDAKTGESGQVEYTEHYPPDTTAAIFWLKNRQPAKWRDRIVQEHVGENGGPVKFVIEGAPE